MACSSPQEFFSACADELTHELNLGHADIEGELGSVHQFVGALANGLDAEFAEVFAGDVAVDSAGIDEK